MRSLCIRPTRASALSIAAGLALPLVATAGPNSAADPETRKWAVGNGYDAVITVNDPLAIGEPGDDLLSLAEAINLANGSLPGGALSPQESAQVRGQPGPHSRDKVRFEVAKNTVEFPQQVQIPPTSPFEILNPETRMPVLLGNDGDAFVGEGVRFINGPESAFDPIYNGPPLGGLALLLSSSDVTFTGITFVRFISNLSVQPADTSGISGVKITGNRFFNGGGISFSATAPDGSRSSLRNVVIANNRFLGPHEFGGVYPSLLNSAVSVIGATAASAASQVRGAVVVENIVISDNVMKGFSGGVQAQAIQSIFSDNSGAKMSRIRIERNEIALLPDAGDPAIYLWGGVALFSGVSDIEVSDLVVKQNNIAANGHIVFITGVETLYGGSPSHGIAVDRVKVIGNRIRPINECRVGITTIAAFPEMGGAAVSGSSMNDVEVEGNSIHGCAWGAFASPVYNWGTPGVSANNSMSSVAFRKNIVTGASTGILVAGGTIVADEGEPTAAVQANKITGLAVQGNLFAASDVGFTVAGGLAKGGAPGLVTSNLVVAKNLSANLNLRGQLCKIKTDFSIDSPATVTGNSIQGLRDTFAPDWPQGGSLRCRAN